mmetsp:Transcript_64301/g.196724  ORF Transcript_64301/g.196724 Transcript_64301/m.196724 type:complete len:297 (+) Transcript_64301:811-1701(+)
MRKELSIGTVNFHRPAPYKSIMCAPSGRSLTRSLSGRSVQTSLAPPWPEAPRYFGGAASKVTNALFSAARVKENGSPHVIISSVALRSSKKRGFDLPPPLPRGSSSTHATVFSGASPYSTISSISCSILLFSLRGWCLLFFHDFSAAATSASSLRNFVLPVRKDGVKDMISKDFNLQASVQKRSSNFGKVSSASCAEPNHLSQPCRSETMASTCRNTGPAGTNLRMRCEVSNTEFAKCTNRLGTTAYFCAMLCEHLRKLLRMFSRPLRPEPQRSIIIFRYSASQCTNKFRNINGSE